MAAIKGLTIEIAGSTTKLDQALKNVKTNSATLNTELRTTDKLLKFESTDKVKLLSDRMGTLKNSAAQVAKEIEILKKGVDANEQAFKSGTISQKDYEQNLAALNQKLKAAEGNYNVFQAEIEETANKLKNAEDGLKGNADAIGKMGKNADDTSKKTLTLGDVIKANLISSAVTGGLKFVGNLIKGIVSGAIAAGKKIFELGRSGLDLVVSTSEWADELLTTASITRQSTTDLQRYQYALKFVDGDLNTLTKSMMRNIKSMEAYQDGNKSVIDGYQRLGVQVKDFDGHLRNSNDVFWETLDALGRIGNETERDALAMELFGKSALELNPLIEAGSEEFRKYGDEAERLGLIMAPEQVERFGVLNDKVEMLKSSFGALKLKLAEVLLPFFEPFVAKVHEFVDSGQLKDLVDKYMPGLVENAGEFGQNIVDFMTGDEAKNFVEEWWPKLKNFIISVVENAPEAIENLGKILGVINDIANKIGDISDGFTASNALDRVKKDVKDFADSIGVSFEDARRYTEDYAETNGLKLSEVYNDWAFHEPRVVNHFIELQRKSQEMSDGLETSMTDSEAALTAGATAIDGKMDEISANVANAKTSTAESAQGIASGLQSGVDSAANVNTTHLESKVNWIIRLYETMKTGWRGIFSVWNANGAGANGGYTPGTIYMGMAAGGVVKAGVPYIVGERGYELFVPRVDGRILNAQQTQQVINNNNTTTNNYDRQSGDINVSMPVYLDNEKIYDGQKKVERRRGSSLIEGGPK